jgi:hypothetical protein
MWRAPWLPLMKGILPESDFDRNRRRDREADEALHRVTNDPQAWPGVTDHAIRRKAEVAVARIDADADRKIAAINSRARRADRAGEQAEPFWRRPRFRRRLTWSTVGATVVLIATLLIPDASTTSSTGSPNSASGGQSITLDGGEKLTIPVGAITGNAPVTATYTAAHSWAGNSPVSDEVTLTSAGMIVGKPVLSLPVGASQATAAQDGALVAAYWSPSTSTWTSYPATCDPATRTMRAVLTHFSTWRIWTRDRGSKPGYDQPGRGGTGKPPDDRCPRLRHRCRRARLVPHEHRNRRKARPVCTGCVMGHPGSNASTSKS